MSEYGNDFIELKDDDGNTIELEHLDTIEIEGDTYMAFSIPDAGIEDEGELVILKVEEEDGEEIFVTVDDEDMLDELYGIFSDRLEEYYEFDDGKEDDADED